MPTPPLLGPRAAGRRAALSAVLAALSLACGSGKPAATGGCQKDADCPAGQGCTQGACVALPCGGACTVDQACSDAGVCVVAQGATCPAAGCPKGYPCNGTTCAAKCLLNSDCTGSYVCNGGSCVQCIFANGDPACAGTSKPSCDTAKGICVQCVVTADCPQGAGHYCDAATDTCQTGCLTDNDCNLGAGEFCNGASGNTPGRCLQCNATHACADTASTCDAQGRCVECTSDAFCTPSRPRCDLGTETCVECLPANNPNGTDCGVKVAPTSPKDPHDEKTCDNPSKKCVDGCQFDAQCGCPRDPATGLVINCDRRWVQEHCDALRTRSAEVAVTTAFEGACVECLNNTQCACLVGGAQHDPAHPECAGNPNAGSMPTGARCNLAADLNGNKADACVPGCDTDADCPRYDAQGKAITKYCVLTPASPSQKLCVDSHPCAAGTVVDNSWCPSADCNAISTANAPLVADVRTLLCRSKRQSEACIGSNECGDTKDPGIGPCISGVGVSKCIYKNEGKEQLGTPTYCSSGHTTSGRCGIPCQSPTDNSCDGTHSCPSGSLCEYGGSENQTSGQGLFCIPSSCRFP